MDFARRYAGVLLPERAGYAELHGATGDAYEEYWQAIAYSQAVRELLFWQVASEVYGAPASEQYAGEMALRVASIELAADAAAHLRAEAFCGTITNNTIFVRF